MSRHLQIGLLKDALVMLSLPPAEQRRLNGPGCLTCDMFEDYQQALSVTQHDGAIQFTPAQSRVLQEIGHALNALAKEDCECFASEAVCRPAWQAIREIAFAALPLFGWQGATIRPFSERSPGVWTRPPESKEGM
jgi:hypothetical protein